MNYVAFWDEAMDCDAMMYAQNSLLFLLFPKFWESIECQYK